MPRDRAAVLTEARACLGTPWIDEGRIKGVALDCIGLIECVAKACGFLDAEKTFQGYGRLPNDGTLERELAKVLDRINAKDMLAGDIALLSVPGAKFPMHLAFIGNYLHAGFGMPFSLIHATTDVRTKETLGRGVEHRLDERWFKRIVSTWRFKGLA